MSYRSLAKEFTDWWEENNGKPPSKGELQGMNKAFAHASDDEMEFALKRLDDDLLEGIVKRINVVTVRQYLRKARKAQQKDKPTAKCEMCLGTGWMDVIIGVDEKGVHWMWTLVPGKKPGIFCVNCPCPNGVGSRVDNFGRQAWDRYFKPHRWWRDKDGRIAVIDGKKRPAPSWYLHERALEDFMANPLRVLKKEKESSYEA